MSKQCEINQSLVKSTESTFEIFGKKFEKNGRFFLPFFQKTGYLRLPKNWLPHWLPQGGGHQRSPEKKNMPRGGRHDRLTVTNLRKLFSKILRC